MTVSECATRWVAPHELRLRLGSQMSREPPIRVRPVRSLPAFRLRRSAAEEPVHSRFSTCKLLMTENTTETPFDCNHAMVFSLAFSTTPSSATSPFLTTMRIGRPYHREYRLNWGWEEIARETAHCNRSSLRETVSTSIWLATSETPWSSLTTRLARERRVGGVTLPRSVTLDPSIVNLMESNAL